MRTVSQDPPTRIRMTSVRLAEPVFLRRPWFRPALEREDGTPLARNEAGERVAPGADGTPVRVSAVHSPLRAGWVLHVDGRPVPSSGPGRSTGLGVLAATFASFVVGGAVSAALCFLVCCAAIAVRWCEGDPATRRRQARVVAGVGAVGAVAVVGLVVLVLRLLGWQGGIVTGALGVL